jgi:sulfur-carrier protein
MICIMLPQHLQALASAPREVQLEVAGPATRQSILDALEARYPMLRGTIRDHVSLKRRPLVRFFACEEDVSDQPPDAPLPEAVAGGKEPFFIVGAIAGGW